jgi:sodium/potassium-transporting ATPase subunit beta
MAKEWKEKIGDRISYEDIGVTCEGENDGDADNLGKVDFYPPKGFNFGYFPYLNADGYKSPLVFAQFSNLRRGTIVQVWCKLWEKNIKHHKNDKGGSVHFELLVDY